MNAIDIKQLEKTYSNGKTALHGIDLHVEEGDFFALLGPNGAGKSTTIGILSSLVKKSAGQVSVFDFDIDKQLSAAKACLGIVPQEINFSLFESKSNMTEEQFKRNLRGTNNGENHDDEMLHEIYHAIKGFIHI